LEPGADRRVKRLKHWITVLPAAEAWNDKRTARVDVGKAGPEGPVNCLVSEYDGGPPADRW
jgi:hypothetical protein